MSPSLYNITISSQCGTVLYKPYRDGPISDGWNVSYSNIPDAMYQQQLLATGPNSHRTTLAGAALEIDWIGTAIYLYGSAPSGSYTVSLDGGNNVTGPSDSTLGLLNSFTGLEYGNHTAVLTVVGGNQVSFEHAVLTIRMGPEGATITNTTQYAAISSTGVFRSFPYWGYPTATGVPAAASTGVTVAANPFFNFSPNWQQGASYTYTANGTLEAGLLLGWTTFTDGATVSFTVNKTTAFFLIGTMNYDHQGYKVTFTPLDNTAASKDLQLNSSSRWFTQDEILYWESGLDRDRSYEVVIRNSGSGAPGFSMYSLVTTDAVGASSTSSASPSSTAHVTAVSNSSKLSSGAMAGITVGTVAVACVLSCVLYFLWIRRRRIPPASPAAPTHMSLHSLGVRQVDDMGENRSTSVGAIHPYVLEPDASHHSTHSDPARPVLPAETSVVPRREIDAGSAATLLPPDYDASWRSAPQSSSGPSSSGSIGSRGTRKV